MTNMTLYYKPTCPYCIKVLDFMEEEGVELEMKDTYVTENLEELKALNNGITQVPCLDVNGHPMLESADIISFLRNIVHS